MIHYGLNLIGAFALRAPDGQKIAISSKKAVALLALLATAPNGTRSRVWLQSMLWGSRGLKQAQSSLRRELANLSRTLVEFGAGQILERNRYEVRLRVELLSVDIDEIGMKAAPQTDVGLMFLEGIDLRDCEAFEDWLREQRSRISQLQEFQIAEPINRLASIKDILGSGLPPSEDTAAAKPPPIPPKPSIVVLPFIDAASASGTNWQGRGLAEEVGASLSQFPQLFIVSSLAGAALVERGLTPVEIAHELGVRFLLGGKMRRADGRLRVTAHLTDGQTGEQFWSRKFGSDFVEVDQLEEEITIAVAPQIWTQVDLAERYRGRSQPIRDGSAYEIYWKANALYRLWNREGIREAIELVDELVKINSECALSSGLAGFCHAIAFRFRWAEDPEQSRRKAIKNYQNAIALGGENVEALGYAAGTLLMLDGDIDLADRLVNHALALLPSHQPTLFWGGWIDLRLSRAERARERFELSLRINPASGVRAYALTGIGISYLLEGQFARAKSVLEPAAATAPEFVMTHAALAVAAGMQGDKLLARKAALQVDKLGGAEVAKSALRSEQQRIMLSQFLEKARQGA